MPKTSGINSGWDDEMRQFLDCTLIGFVWILSFVIGAAFMVYSEKTALEIKILQHELAAYEAMDKELKSE